MIIDIFSSFDPQCYASSLRSYFVWGFGVLLGLFIVNRNFWVRGSSLKGLIHRLNSLIFDQARQTNMRGFFFRNTLISGLFFILVVLNFIGLIPYVFAPTRHLRFSFGLAFVIWLSIIISSFVYNFYNRLASFLPGGAPWWLNPFLIVIEFVRLRVRPLTSAFRLAANITAGHIVLTLIREFMGGLLLRGGMGWLVLGLINMFYLIFEIGVRLIQAYIFCLLLTLYSNDHQV